MIAPFPSPGRAAGPWLAALGFALLAATPVLGHDPTRMSWREIEIRAQVLIERLEDPPRLAALAPAGLLPAELARRLARLPEVRELIHLRPQAGEVVIDRLAKLPGTERREQEILACALVWVLEQSEHRGAIPTLVALPPAWLERTAYLPGFATQALLALAGAPGQDPVGYSFPPKERARAREAAQRYATTRVAELVADLAGQDVELRWVGASGPKVLHNSLSEDPKLRELGHLASLDAEPLLAAFAAPQPDLAGDYRRSALARALEFSGQRAAIPTLASFIANPDSQKTLFARFLATHAVITLAGLEDPRPDSYAYSDEEIARVLGLAGSSKLSEER